MKAAQPGTPKLAAIEEIAAAGRTLDPAVLMRRDRPLVIRGLVRNWPLVQHALESDSAFARALAKHDTGQPVNVLRLPPEVAGVVGYTQNLDGFNYEHYRVTLTQALQRLAAYSQIDAAPGVAIQSVAVESSVPGLLAELVLPGLDPAIRPRLWVGNRVTTPVHFDSQHNIACVVCGERRFTLFPPEQLPNLYIGPLDFAPTGAAISVARLDQADDPRYPRLGTALAAASVATLAPGDAIYMPPLWWHHVESRARLNALINFWWPSLPGPGRDPGDSLAALFHAILAFRDLPPAERAHWRRLLEHYVFSTDDPLPHVPAERRGVLGPATPATLRRLRQQARAHLDTGAPDSK